MEGYNFALCDVLSVDDSAECYRIKVRIPGTPEMQTPIEDLPFCFPLLPKLLLINPKVGEKVIVLFQKADSKDSFRMFIGPIITQDYMINYSPGTVGNGRTTMSPSTLSSNMPMGKKIANGGGSENTIDANGMFDAPSRNPENDGSIPDRDAIVLRGRANTDIVLKDSETQIRCGFKENPFAEDVKSKLKYNPNDLGYIQLKHNPRKDEKDIDYKSSVNIVADRINLLSHDSDTGVNLGKPNDLIDDEAMLEVLKKAHPLPYGDELVAFLKDFVRVFKEHTHPFHQEPPCLNEANTNAISIDLDNILSKTIKIN